MRLSGSNKLDELIVTILIAGYMLRIKTKQISAGAGAFSALQEGFK